MTTKAAGPGPYDIAYDPAKSELFVTNPKNNTVAILSDSITTSTSSIQTGTSGANIYGYLPWLLVVLLLVVSLVILSRRRRKRSDSGGISDSVI